MKINDKLPEWAPEVLIESIQYQTMHDGALNPDILEIEKALCTSKHMENAWRLLREKFKDQEYFMFDAFVSEFVIQVYGAYFKRGGYGADSKLEIQKRERIIQLMTSLSAELDNSPYDYDALKYFSKGELKRFHRFLFSAADAFDSIMIHRIISNETNQLIDEDFYTYNKLFVPSLSDILYRCAQELSKIQSDPVLGKEKSTTNDGDFNLHLRWFLRVMAKYFRNKFNSPNYKILADLGNTFFGGADLDEKKVGSILQERRKKPTKAT